MLKSSEYKIYSKFLNNLATKLTRFYYSKLNKPFKFSNKNAFVVENIKKRKIKVNKKVLFSKIKMSAAFHGCITLNQQKKNSKNFKTHAVSLC